MKPAEQSTCWKSSRARWRIVRCLTWKTQDCLWGIKTFSWHRNINCCAFKIYQQIFQDIFGHILKKCSCSVHSSILFFSLFLFSMLLLPCLQVIFKAVGVNGLFTEQNDRRSRKLIRCSWRNKSWLKYWWTKTAVRALNFLSSIRSWYLAKLRNDYKGYLLTQSIKKKKRLHWDPSKSIIRGHKVTRERKPFQQAETLNSNRLMSQQTYAVAALAEKNG